MKKKLTLLLALILVLSVALTGCGLSGIFDNDDKTPDKTTDTTQLTTINYMGEFKIPQSYEIGDVVLDETTGSLYYCKLGYVASAGSGTPAIKEDNWQLFLPNMSSGTSSISAELEIAAPFQYFTLEAPMDTKIHKSGNIVSYNTCLTLAEGITANTTYRITRLPTEFISNYQVHGLSTVYGSNAVVNLWINGDPEIPEVHGYLSFRSNVAISAGSEIFISITYCLE